MPRWKRPPRDQQEQALRQNALHDWARRDLIHRAVHVNDPHARDVLARLLSDDVFAGRPLTPASRKWLAWILVHLADGDEVPHLARGNAIKADSFERIRRLADVMHSLPSTDSISNRLKKAATILCVSVGTVRKTYYSETFRAIAAALSKQLQPK
jgi:hypothetical protein